MFCGIIFLVATDQLMQVLEWMRPPANKTGGSPGINQYVKRALRVPTTDGMYRLIFVPCTCAMGNFFTVSAMYIVVSSFVTTALVSLYDEKIGNDTNVLDIGE